MHGRGSSLVVYAKLQVRLEVHWLSGRWVGGSIWLSAVAQMFFKSFSLNGRGGLGGSRITTLGGWSLFTEIAN